MRKYWIIAFVSIWVFNGCGIGRKFPKEKYNQFKHSSIYEYKNDSLLIHVKNPLMCPLRFSFSSKDVQLDKKLALLDTLTIHQKTDTLLKLYFPTEEKPSLKISSLFGNTEEIIQNTPISLPFLENKKFKIIQGYNGSYSHYSTYSKYAIDFNLKIGDTVCAADNGYVVGVIKDYEYGGSSSKWRKEDKSNFITIYHPATGIYSQYVHLKQNGAFVKLGDAVKKNQPIGLSGMTGYTDIPHLHFNTLVPKKGGSLKSIPVIFENRLDGKSLKKGMEVEK